MTGSVILKYKFTWLFLLSVVAAIFLYESGFFARLVGALGSYDYLGALIAGMFYGFSFTSVLASFFFVESGAHYNPYVLAILGGAGAMMVDLVLYKFVRDHLFLELKELAKILVPAMKHERWALFTGHYLFAWVMLILGIFLIATPLPDEIGLAFFGAAKVRVSHVLMITFVLNTLGILSLNLIGRALV